MIFPYSGKTTCILRHLYWPFALRGLPLTKTKLCVDAQKNMMGCRAVIYVPHRVKCFLFVNVVVALCFQDLFVLCDAWIHVYLSIPFGSIWQCVLSETRDCCIDECTWSTIIQRYSTDSTGCIWMLCCTSYDEFIWNWKTWIHSNGVSTQWIVRTHPIDVRIGFLHALQTSTKCMEKEYIVFLFWDGMRDDLKVYTWGWIYIHV